MRIHFSARIGVLIIAVLTAPFTFAAPLSDISSNVHENAIEYLYDQGIISGYSDGTFRPERTVNRAELLKILTIREGMHPEIKKYHDCFPDVKTEWFAPYVCYAKEQGWVSGYPDGTFRSANTLNTAEAIKIIMIAIGFRPNQSSAASSVIGVEPGSWYAPYVEAAFAHRILESTGTALDVGKDMSRANVAAMVYRSMAQRAEGGKQDTSLRGSLRRGGGGGNRTGESDSHVPIITFADISKTYGDSSFTLSALSNSLGHITYTSSNTSVATIAGSRVTIVGAGSAVITATQAADGRFVGNTATAVLTVNGIAPTITFSNLTKSRIDANFTLSATSDSPGAITYTSGNSGLVSISGTTADIVGIYGTVIITANQAASGNYAAGSAMMTLTVFHTYCISSPCINDGVCVPTLEGDLTDDNYVCECADHYSGDNCFMSDLNCSENGGDLFCFNSGNCIPSEDGGECDCINGFCGAQCTILPSQCD